MFSIYTCENTSAVVHIGVHTITHYLLMNRVAKFQDRLNHHMRLIVDSIL